MSFFTNVLLITVLCVAIHSATDLQIGTITNASLAYQENVKLSAVPFTRREKNVFYNSNNTKIIKGISAVDLNKTKATVTIKAGGIGFSFVNVQLLGEKGERLNYLVQVFV